MSKQLIPFVECAGCGGAFDASLWRCPECYTPKINPAPAPDDGAPEGYCNCGGRIVCGRCWDCGN